MNQENTSHPGKAASEPRAEQPRVSREASPQPRALPRYRRAAGTEQRQAPPILLTGRDLALLEDVWHFRFLTTTQIETLRAADQNEENRFVSRLTLTRRLKLLFHHRYLRRIARPLAQGSREPVYLLDAEGARALSRLHGEVSASPPSRLPAQAALDHLLSIGQVRLSLSVAKPPGHSSPDDSSNGNLGRGGNALVEWMPGEKTRFRVTLEDSGRRKQGVTIVPDGCAIVRLGGFLHHAFIEVDRGTEPQRTITGKGRAYLTYWESGGFARDFNVPVGLGFRVLFVAPTPKRAQTILKAVSHLQGPRQIFRVALAEDVIPERVLKTVWLDGATGQYAPPFA